MIKLNSSRKYTFVYRVLDEDDKPRIELEPLCEIYFEFPFSEEIDNSDFRKAITNKMKELKIPEKDKVKRMKELISLDDVQNIQLKRMRESITGWKDIKDEHGKDLEFNQYNVKIVFEFVKNTYLWTDIQQAFLGLELKN